MSATNVGDFSIGVGGLAQLRSLPDRMSAHFEANLIVTMGFAADKVIDYAQAQLVPGHGYDTGLLRDSLTKNLVELGLGAGVFYTLGSDAADYWTYVEFGHMMADGTFWEGYHFLGNAVNKQRPLIFRMAYEAWRKTAATLDIESRSAIASLVRT